MCVTMADTYQICGALMHFILVSTACVISLFYELPVRADQPTPGYLQNFLFVPLHFALFIYSCLLLFTFSIGYFILIIHFFFPVNLLYIMRVFTILTSSWVIKVGINYLFILVTWDHLIFIFDLFNYKLELN